MKELTHADSMIQVGKYRGWKKGEERGYSLGNRKADAIATAKANGLDMVLKIGKNGNDGEWIWDR